MIPENRFVGRSEEIDRFETLLARLNDGWGGLLLVSGNAGIGKTSIAREFHAAAGDRGAFSLWTSFPEQVDCPPYWGWINVCRAIETIAPGSGAGDLGEAMSGPREVAQDAMNISYVQRLGEVFTAVSARSPLVLFFDDIQHADRASARLLEAMLSQIYDLPVLIVGTFRTGEAQSPAIGSRAIPRLASTPQAQRLVLRGVDELECAEICRELSGWTPAAAIARRLHRQTEGNPLFIKQIVQWLLDHGYIKDGVAKLPPRLSVPEGISEATQVLLDRASAPCRRTLERAAVLGRRFESRVLQALDPEFDADVLDEADRLGLLRVPDAARGIWEFTHALIREVLYDAIPPMKRVRSHAEAATAIEEVYGAENPQALAALAYHAFEGQLFYGAGRVIDLARRAAGHALSVGAYEDAAAHNALALECFKVPGVNAETTRIDVALDLALAERLAGDNLASIKTCREAMELARALEDWPRYTAASLLYEAARWQPGLPSTEVIRCLETALGHQDAVDEKDVVRIHYSLARAYQWQGALEKVRQHALESIHAAGELGDDLLFCEAIDQGGSALHAIPGTSALRDDLNTKGIAAARRCGDNHRLAHLLVNRGVINCEAGHMNVFRKTYHELCGLAHELAQPHLQYIAHQWGVTIAMLDGDFAKASNVAATAVDIGGRISGANAAGIFGIQMFLIKRETGALEQFAALARSIGDQKGNRLWRPGYALLLAETGDHDQAREQLGAFLKSGLDAVPHDDLRKLTLSFLAEVAWQVKDEEVSHALFERLAGEAGTAATCGPAAICFGPVDRTLGKLKAVLKNFDEARKWLDRASRQSDDWKSPPVTLRTACDYCEVLLLEGSPEAIKHARMMEARFANEATEIGMASLARRFAEISSQLRTLATTHGFDRLTAREVEVLRVLAQGASNAEISQGLGISLATTATHVRNILAKTECRNRTAAAAFARRVGLTGRQGAN